EQTISQPAINQTLVIKKEPGQKVTPASSKSESAAVQLVNAIKGDSRHKEDDFNDFNHEPLLPRMHSTEGPELITGDINGDGRSDFIALGATGDVDKVFVQNENGRFSRQQTNAFDADRNFESTCGALFDEDNDGDLDLVLGSGGNDFSIGMRGYLLRFYENDGRGNFTRQLGKTPPAGGQFSAIIPADFDADGDMDLFIAARSIPGNYGLTPRSFLLMKDLGKWRDIAPKELATAGMITDAAWADYDGDGSFDLVLAGEWMPITVFLNKRGDFSQSIRIPNSEGWWLDIAPGDVDQDGDLDFVLGNWGLNTKFKASPEHPMSLYVKDFDKNGKSEFVINWKPPADDKTYPFPSKMDLTGQLPSLKKRILKYSEYATMDYESLFTAEEKAQAIERKVVYLESAILRNNNGQYILEALPAAAQVSPIFASAIDDFNKDGKPDIWLGGNFYGLKPEVGRHNDSRSILLLGKEDGGFEAASQLTETIEGEIRTVKRIKEKDGSSRLLIGINDGPVKVLKY
ncbi:MAG: VCBS repeat-containing protein, partial [Bacteroidota bacterium]